jgi:hypothetical protein
MAREGPGCAANRVEQYVCIRELTTAFVLRRITVGLREMYLTVYGAHRILNYQRRISRRTNGVGGIEDRENKTIWSTCPCRTVGVVLYRRDVSDDGHEHVH